MITARRHTYRLFSAITALCVAAVLCAVSPLAHATEVTKQDIELAANAGDFSHAYELLLQLAKSGNAQAQSFLAFVLYEGEWGVPVDEMQAKGWMEKAYAQNDAYAHMFVAQTNMPHVVEENAKDTTLIQSLDWKKNIKAAAENGHPYAQGMMGSWALKDQNYENAVEWYRKASKPNRDYYAVYQYLIETEFLKRRPFRHKDFHKFSPEGNATGFLMLATSSVNGVSTLADIKRAYFYGMQAHYLRGDKTLKSLKKIQAITPEGLQIQIANDAWSQLMTWANDPQTYLGQAAAFCLNQDADKYECLRYAIDDHRFCSIDYDLWNFTKFTDFQAYKTCRKETAAPSPDHN